MKYMMFGTNPTLKQFLKKKCGIYLRSLFTDDDRSLSLSRNFYEDFK